jgi:hypothetical protein
MSKSLKVFRGLANEPMERLTACCYPYLEPDVAVNLAGRVEFYSLVVQKLTRASLHKCFVSTLELIPVTNNAIFLEADL